MKQLNNTALIASQYPMWKYGCIRTKKASTLVVLMGIALGTFLSIGLPTVYAANIFVTKAGSPDPDGSSGKPYQMVEAGIVRAKRTPGSTVVIGPGKYYEMLTIDRPCTLTAMGGTATIGEMDYDASTMLELVTLNTHLYGDIDFPFVELQWQDYERAVDISNFILNELNRSPDVVCFQEIWDEDLFLGGDDAGLGILGRAQYNHGYHGRMISLCPGHFPDYICSLNSGCAIMSHYKLDHCKQVGWVHCDGFFECRAAKGYVRATIQKDGFTITIFNLHTQAGGGSDEIKARRRQIQQLKSSILVWREDHPSEVVFAMGDFNIIGESSEYELLVDRLGRDLGGRDGARNSPGFIVDSTDRRQWTSDDQNPLFHFFDSVEMGRLDYIYYFPSLDGSVEIMPMDVRVRPFRGEWHSEDGTTTNESSDHYGIQGKFKLIKT